MAREEKPHIPPERKAVSEFQTPSPTVVFFTELVNRTDPAYVKNSPIPRGQLYSNIVGANQKVIATYPDLFFVRERKFGTSDQLVLWDWATDPAAEDTYNAEVTYVGQAVPYPSFTRVYTIRRDQYDINPTIAIGTPLTGLLGVFIANVGQGYTTATGTIDGTTVNIEFQIFDGQIYAGVITDEGAGVTSGSYIRIVGDGLGAVAIPIVQSTNCVLTSQKKEELPEGNPLRNEYVRVIRVYETLPGPIITETAIDKNGDITTITRQRVVASTISTTSTVVAGVWTKTYEVPVQDNQYVATKTIEVRNTQNPLNSYEVSIPDLLPEEFRPQLPITTTETTLIGTASLPVLAIGDLMRRQAQLDQYTYRLTISGRGSITLPQVVTNKETTSQFGGGDINITLTLDLFNNLTLDEGLTILVPSKIDKLDDLTNGLAVKESRILNASSWPILFGTHIDPTYQLEIDIQRQTVAAGTQGGVLIDGTIVDVKPHDKWKSIQISSKFNTSSLPQDTIWFSGQNHSFPPVLNTNTYPTDPLGVVILWAEATCGCADKFSAVLQANMKEYRGAVKTRITEQFYFGVPPDDVTITQFFPQSHTFGFAFASVCGCGDAAVLRAIAPQFRIPLCLHDTFTLTVGIAYSWTFPATSPAALPSGTYIMLPPHIERWRFGVFRRVLTEVLVP